MLEEGGTGAKRHTADTAVALKHVITAVRYLLFAPLGGMLQR